MNLSRSSALYSNLRARPIRFPAGCCSCHCLGFHDVSWF